MFLVSLCYLNPFQGPKNQHIGNFLVFCVPLNSGNL